jgi:hypothetical protein
VLAIPGNELQNYTSENFIEGVANKFDKDQSGVYRREKDMVQQGQVRAQPGAQSGIFRTRSVSQLDRVESATGLFSTLSQGRRVDGERRVYDTHGLGQLLCRHGRGVWPLVGRGIPQCIPADMIARGQCGRDYPFHYLEATANDALYYVYDAARNPGIMATLPGQPSPCLPADLRPQQWARALVGAFETLVTSCKKLEKFLNYSFYTKHQPRPPATFKRKKPAAKAPTGKVKNTDIPDLKTTLVAGEGKRAKAREKALLLTNGSPEIPCYRGVCANDLFAHYKAPFKAGVDVKKCSPSCPRLHVEDYLSSQQSRHVLNIAEKYCKPQMEEAAYAKLAADIKADKRMK